MGRAEIKREINDSFMRNNTVVDENKIVKCDVYAILLYGEDPLTANKQKMQSSNVMYMQLYYFV